MQLFVVKSSLVSFETQWQLYNIYIYLYTFLIFQEEGL